MSLFMGMFALLMWFYRSWLRVVRWAVIGAYLSAEILMTRPAYYLISKIDLTGSSTGWHRSRLIESAFEHLSEWWAFGTDYTGHWMPYTLDATGSTRTSRTTTSASGSSAGSRQCCSLSLSCGVRSCGWEKASGTPLLALQEHRFMIWCLGAGLFAHAGTSLSVAYFDQSMMFFWLNIGVISSMYSVVTMAVAAEKPASRCRHSRCQAAGGGRWRPTSMRRLDRGARRRPSPPLTRVMSPDASQHAPSSH